MRWDVTLWFEDRDRNQRRCTTRVQGLGTIADLVAFANGFAGVAQALSSARVVRGSLNAAVPLTTNRTAAPDSDIQRKLLFLARQNEPESYGSLVIPSPALLPWPTQGDYAGFRLTRSDLAGHQVVNLIDAVLPLIVRPDNLPFPTDDWVLALLSD